MRYRVIKAYLAKKADEEHLLSPEEQKIKHTELKMQQEKQLSELEKKIGPMRVREQLGRETMLAKLRSLLKKNSNDFLPMLSQFIEETGRPHLVADVALEFAPKTDRGEDLQFLVHLKALTKDEVKPMVRALMDKDASTAKDAYIKHLITEEEGMPYFVEDLKEHLDMLSIYQTHYGITIPAAKRQEIKSTFLKKLADQLRQGSTSAGVQLANLVKFDEIDAQEARPLAELYFEYCRIFEDVNKWDVFITAKVLTLKEVQKYASDRARWVSGPDFSKDLLHNLKLAEDRGYLPKGFLEGKRDGKNISFEEAVDIWGRGSMEPEEYWGYIKKQLDGAPSAKYLEILRWALMRFPQEKGYELYDILRKELVPYYAKKPKIKKQFQADSVVKHLVPREL